MNKNSGRYAVGDGQKDEQKSRDHRKANVSFLRQMQRYFGNLRREPSITVPTNVASPVRPCYAFRARARANRALRRLAAFR